MNNPINPKELINKLSVEDFNHYADEYYKKQGDPIGQIGKPFTTYQATADFLVRFGLILQSLKFRPGMRVLDFGAGSGWMSKMICQMGGQAIALDVSEESLRLSNRSFNEFPVASHPSGTFSTLLFDGRKIDLPDESVDRIICFDAFHHVPNASELIPELYRVLKKQGILAMSEPVGEHSQTEISQHEMREFKFLENDLDVNEMARDFLKAGFANISFKLAASPELTLSLEERAACVAGSFSKRTKYFISDFLGNCGVMLIHKGSGQLDSTQATGLSATIQAELPPMQVSRNEVTNIQAHIVNTGKALWLHDNFEDKGNVYVGICLLHRRTKKRVIDIARIPLPHDMEPGDSIDLNIPISVPNPGKFILKVDIVSERVTWLNANGTNGLTTPITISK